MSSSSQPPRYIDSDRKPSSLQQPKGARPKYRKANRELDIIGDNNGASLVQNMRVIRALPTIPQPGPSNGPSTSARTHTQSGNGIRPLPSCPPSSPLNSQFYPSSSTQSTASPAIMPAAFFIPVAGPPPRSSPSPLPITPDHFEDQLEPHVMCDDSSVEMEPLDFMRPREYHGSDYTSEDDEGAPELYQPKEAEERDLIVRRWRRSRREMLRQPNSPLTTTKKWVIETKGNRVTMGDYDNVLKKLRTL